MTSRVFSAAVGPMRSVQKVLEMKVVCAASMTSRRPIVAVIAVAVAQRLAKHRHVRLNAIELVQAAEGLAESGGAFVEDQHDAVIVGQLAHILAGSLARGPTLRETSILITPMS